MKTYIHLKNIVEENICQECKLKIIGRNELMSKECKKVCTTLNFIEYFLILASTFTGLVSISSFASLVGIPIEITSFAIGLKFVQ